MARPRYTLTYAADVKLHLDAIDVKHHSLIRRKIEEQLQFDPTTETRNRKPLRAPAPLEAEWEIRFGPNNRFRVLYDVNAENHEVFILAIGIKDGNRLIIAGEDVEL